MTEKKPESKVVKALRAISTETGCPFPVSVEVVDSFDSWKPKNLTVGVAETSEGTEIRCYVTPDKDDRTEKKLSKVVAGVLTRFNASGKGPFIIANKQRKAGTDATT